VGRGWAQVGREPSLIRSAARRHRVQQPFEGDERGTGSSCDPSNSIRPPSGSLSWTLTHPPVSYQPRICRGSKAPVVCSVTVTDHGV